MEVGGIGDVNHWRVTFFYGFPAEADRHKTWRLLKRLSQNSDLPWCCLGDFNEIVYAHEQEGGDICNQAQMDGFRNALNSCQLQNLGYVDNKFTWVTTRCGGIKVRLDRVVAMQQWVDMFPNFRVSNLKPNSSDHVPILLEWQPQNRGKLKRSFCYEE